MEVTRDDEIPSVPSAVSESMQASYYVNPGLAPMYGPMYGFENIQPGSYPYAAAYAGVYHPQLYPMAAMPAAYPDQTDIMSMIPTLRCWSCTKCGNLNYAHRLTCNLRKCQRMSEQGGGAGADVDWICACGNVNYRFRKYCNLRKCQLPQIGNPFLFFGISQLIKAGYAPQTALSLLLTNSANTSDGGNAAEWINGKHSSITKNSSAVGPPSPPGSSPEAGCWQCKDCGNLNWSWREECNRKGCTQVKKNSAGPVDEPKNEESCE